MSTRLVSAWMAAALIGILAAVIFHSLICAKVGLGCVCVALLQLLWLMAQEDVRV